MSRHTYRREGGRFVVVGMDACLMTMIEVGYKIRDHAQRRI